MSNREYRAWRKENGLVLSPLERWAIFMLDGVLCHPGSFEEKES